MLVTVAASPVRSTRMQKWLLVVFGVQTVWTGASLLWATSLANAWEETNRTVFYALAVFLVFAALRWAGATGLKVLALSIAGLATIVAAVVIATLATSGDPLALFVDGRLNYPITYYNGLAALLMMGFWLLLVLANGARYAPKEQTPASSAQETTQEGDAPESRMARRRARVQRPVTGGFRRWTQPVLLVLAVVLLELALLPQSRGAFWTFFLVIPFYVIFSPHRFRALFDLAIMVVPVVLFWNTLNGPYLAIRDGAPLGPVLQDALIVMGYSAAIMLGAWLISWLIERWAGPLRRRAAVWLSVALAVLLILGAAGGIVYADIRSGGLEDYLSDRWQEVTSDTVGDLGASRFAAVGLNGRLQQWKVSAKAGAEHPALGLGAQNFEYYWYQHRTTPLDVRQPHSQPMQLFSELGVPGLVLWLAFVLLALIHGIIVRFRSPDRTNQVAVAAVMIAAISWFIHSSADWLWQLAAVSLPALMLLGGLAGANGGAGAGAESPPPVAHRAPWRSARSALVRGTIVLLGILALASAAFPYLSLRFSEMAAGEADLDQMTAHARTAAVLDPTSVLPFATRAAGHLAAASEAPATSTARFQQLRLAAQAWEEALEREPGSWVCHFQAAKTYLMARDAALAAGSDLAEEIEAQARKYLSEASRLNPLSSEIDLLWETLETGTRAALD